MSMQMYRTANISITPTDFKAALNALFAEVFEGWLTSSEIVTSTDYTDYKISTSLWLRVKSTGIYYVSNGTESDYSIYDYSNSYNYNATVLKLDKCLVFCGLGDYSSTRYSLRASFIVDSIDDDNGAAILYRWGYDYAQIIDSKTNTLLQTYSPFNSNSYNLNTSIMQVAPVINSTNGAKLDNLYHVLITPINTACFVDFNGQKWWANDINFALPAGNAEPAPIYVPVTS